MYNYYSTPLEDWIQSFFKHLNINNPYQLDIIDIAFKLNIWIYFEDISSKAIERNGLYSMVIDRRLSPPEQWEDFGHELCHLLRQAGNQLLLPNSFVEFQETKANNFAQHFCIPTFMLLKLCIPTQISEAVSFIAETFNVTPRFAKERLARFERQIINSQITEQLAATVDVQEQFIREIGCDYAVRTGNSTMLYSRQRGVIGYIK